MTAPYVIKYNVPERRPPVVAANNNNADVRCCIYKKISPPVSSSPSLDSPTKSISSNSKQPFYYFIREGDFDLVWTNIIVFLVANVFYIYAFLNLHSISWKTWVWENQIGKYSIECKRFTWNADLELMISCPTCLILMMMQRKLGRLFDRLRCPPTLGSQVVRRDTRAQDLLGDRSNDRRSELHLHLVPRSPGASQVLRHGR